MTRAVPWLSQARAGPARRQPSMAARCRHLTARYAAALAGLLLVGSQRPMPGRRPSRPLSALRSDSASAWPLRPRRPNLPGLNLPGLNLPGMRLTCGKPPELPVYRASAGDAADAER